MAILLRGLSESKFAPTLFKIKPGKTGLRSPLKQRSLFHLIPFNAILIQYWKDFPYAPVSNAACPGDEPDILVQLGEIGN